MITTSISAGREDAAHAEKNARLAAAEDRARRLGEYGTAAMKDYYRMRDTLYELEQMALQSAENVPEHKDSYLYMADRARHALRNYRPLRS